MFTESVPQVNNNSTPLTPAGDGQGRQNSWYDGQDKEPKKFLQSEGCMRESRCIWALLLGGRPTCSWPRFCGVMQKNWKIAMRKELELFLFNRFNFSYDTKDILI